MHGHQLPPYPTRPPAQFHYPFDGPVDPPTFGERFIAKVGPQLAFQIILALAFAFVASFVTVLILNNTIHQMDRARWVDAAAGIFGKLYGIS